MKELKRKEYEHLLKPLQLELAAMARWAAHAGARIVVLMEEDNVSDDGANSGHAALNAAVQDALNSIIPTLGFGNEEVTDEAVSALMETVQSRIESAIKNQQNVFENIFGTESVLSF